MKGVPTKKLKTNRGKDDDSDGDFEIVPDISKLGLDSPGPLPIPEPADAEPSPVRGGGDADAGSGGSEGPGKKTPVADDAVSDISTTAPSGLTKVEASSSTVVSLISVPIGCDNMRSKYSLSRCFVIIPTLI